MIDDINDSIEERAAQAQNYTDALVSQWVDLMLKFPISTIVVSFLLAGIMWNISKKYYTNKFLGGFLFGYVIPIFFFLLGLAGLAGLVING